MITDGKPDTSTSMVLDEVRKMNAHRHLSINVVSFYCEEKYESNTLNPSIPSFKSKIMGYYKLIGRLTTF
jgi:hypothetical protein